MTPNPDLGDRGNRLIDNFSPLNPDFDHSRQNILNQNPAVIGQGLLAEGQEGNEDLQR